MGRLNPIDRAVAREDVGEEGCCVIGSCLEKLSSESKRLVLTYTYIIHWPKLIPLYFDLCIELFRDHCQI